MNLHTDSFARNMASIARKPLTLEQARDIVTRQIGPRPLIPVSTSWHGYRSNSDAAETSHALNVLRTETAARNWDRKISALLEQGA
jgi:hypothetical protein